MGDLVMHCVKASLSHFVDFTKLHFYEYSLYELSPVCNHD